MPLRRTPRPGATDLAAVSPARQHRAAYDAELTHTPEGPAAHPAPHHGPHHAPRPTPDPVTGITLLDALLDKAVAIPSAAVHEHVMKTRARNPYATPAQVVDLLGKQYLLAVAASGGAVGAAAAAPAVGTGVGLALTTSEIATFFAASSAYALAVASVHGVEVTDTARRRTLLLATVLGEQGAQLVGGQTGVNAAGWAKSLLGTMPAATVRRVNRALASRMLRKQATRQGVLALGRIAPFGIGAVIGVTGARAMGRTVVAGAWRAFGPPPDRFPAVLELEASTHDTR
jgi:hypothetical protein